MKHYTIKTNIINHYLFENSKASIAKLTGSVEYSDCTSAEG